MQTAISKLTKKYQATIPEPVRRILNLGAGDTIAFEIDDERVLIRKSTSLDVVFAQALEETLSEWTSDADEEAYREL